jgi:superfamily I DNA/RNA helicase
MNTFKKVWSKFQEAVFAFVREGKGSAVIEAVAGSGKTTTLVEAVKHMVGDVAVMAYNKKMGDELKVRLSSVPYANAGTCHSFGLKAFTKSGIRPNVDARKVGNIVGTLLKKEEDFMFAFICKLVGLAKDSGIGFLCDIDDHSQWQRLIDHHDLSIENGDVDYGKAIDLAITTLKKSNADKNTIDFGDMIYMPLFFGLKVDQYDWVLVDEAQDTNATRRALAAAMLKPNGRLLAVGDPRQAIFGFTGADNNSLDLIRSAFKAITLPLSVCYRCGSNIITHAKNWNPTIVAHESNGEGKVTQTRFEDFIKGVESLNLSGNDGIICRKNAPLMDLAFSLIRKGIACRIEGKDIGAGLVALAQKWKVQDLNKLSERLVAFRNREVSKLLEKGQETKAEQVEDKVDTLLVLLARCKEQNKHNVFDLVALIKSMFSDSDDKFTNKNLVTLSSVHKSKGLEWNRVFLLGREQFMPSKYAKKQWQKDQERNLIYVAVTRAMTELVEVCEIPEASDRRKAKGN